jgi:hypothetical protein
MLSEPGAQCTLQAQSANSRNKTASGAKGKRGRQRPAKKRSNTNLMLIPLPLSSLDLGHAVSVVLGLAERRSPKGLVQWTA